VCSNPAHRCPARRRHQDRDSADRGRIQIGEPRRLATTLIVQGLFAFRKVSTGSSRPQTATSIFHFHIGYLAGLSRKRQRSIAVLLCSSRGRLFLRVIAPGPCLSEAIATGPRLLLPPPERLMGYGNTTRKLRDNPLFRMDSPQSPSVLSRRTKKM
jgi:hypothetical protein